MNYFLSRTALCEDFVRSHGVSVKFAYIECHADFLYNS